MELKKRVSRIVFDWLEGRFNKLKTNEKKLERISRLVSWGIMAGAYVQAGCVDGIVGIDFFFLDTRSLTILHMGGFNDSFGFECTEMGDLTSVDNGTLELLTKPTRETPAAISLKEEALRVLSERKAA